MGKKRASIKMSDTEEEKELVRVSSCQGIDVALQLSSMTSATKSPSNCSAVPKHLANAQLMSADAVSHWLRIPLSADRLVRRSGRDKTGRRGEKKKKRDGNMQENEDNCTYQSQSWC